MKIKIYDYENRERKVDVGDLKDIAYMAIVTVTGDEILLYQKKGDYILDRCDADDFNGGRRKYDYLDGFETLYYEGIPAGLGIYMDDGSFDPNRVEEGQC